MQPGQPGRPQTKKDVASDAARALRQYIEKMLLLRGERDVICKVIQPAESRQPYSIILGKGPITEQLFLGYRDVVLFAQTGSDVNLSLQIRSAIQNLNKRFRRKTASRS